MSTASLTRPSTAGDASGSQSALLAWVATVDHKRIGIMYMVAALGFFLAGGVLALLLRIQLAAPRSEFLDPHTYNVAFSMHGTTMIFFFAMPLLIGAMNYLVPLQIGARDMAFPRLNAFGFWLFLFSGVFFYGSFLVAGGAPDVGWFSYAPLSQKPFTLNHGVDYWALALLTLGIGSITASINLIATIARMRAPGMSMRRLPLFTWMALVTAVLVVVALGILNAALVLFLVDRLLNGNFFRPARGGSVLLWQHVFWAFGHPEVYILVIPAFGIISEVIQVFARRPIFGYRVIAVSTVLIALLSFGVWAHHMFTVGLPAPLNAFFAAMTMLIAVPTGVKVLSWIATLFGGAIRFTVAMCFTLAFLLQFTIGGITGVMFAAYPLDWQLTDSYFVVAHLHYVLVGGTLFAVFAGAYYWFPKITGRMLSERIGLVHFWLAVVGFNLIFFVQHFLGVLGMPRRVYTYPEGSGWALLNMISTIGAFVFAASILAFLANIVRSMRRGRPAGANPWSAYTLEWATTSPPPAGNFDRLPPVRSRRPVWDLAHPENPDWRRGAEAGGEVLA